MATIEALPLQSFTGSIVDLVLLSIVGFLVWIFAVVIYRLYFHPLAKYPGPFLAKITVLHHGYYAWKGRDHLHFTRCHEKYGPIFRSEPNSLSFNSAQALQDIYGLKNNATKSLFYQVFAKGGFQNILTIVDIEGHRNRRRLLGNAFSERALRSVEDLMLHQVDNWFAKVKQSTAPLNMSRWAKYLTTDVMGDLALGKAFRLIDGENHWLGPFMMRAARHCKIIGFMPFLRTTGLEKYLFPQTFKDEKEWINFGAKMVDERIHSNVPHHDFFHYLLEAKDDKGNGLPMEELVSEANTIMAAGSDTSSTALTATVFYLGKNPEYRAKAAQEVRTVFKDQDTATIRSGTELGSCKYLKAVIDEAMRLSPPVLGYLPRTVATGGAFIDGHQIPAGTEVGMCLFTLHHNSDYFTDAWTYNPDRWFSSSPADLKKMRSAYAPFLIGTRNCIGKRMAEMELTIVLARLLKDYDFTLIGDLGTDKERAGHFDYEDWWLALTDGPMVSFTPAKV